MKQASSRKVQNLTVYCKLLEVFLCRTFLFEQKEAVSVTLIIIKDIESKNKNSFNRENNIDKMQHFGIV